MDFDQFDEKLTNHDEAPTGYGDAELEYNSRQSQVSNAMIRDPLDSRTSTALAYSDFFDHLGIQTQPIQGAFASYVENSAPLIQRAQNLLAQTKRLFSQPTALQSPKPIVSRLRVSPSASVKPIVSRLRASPTAASNVITTTESLKPIVSRLRASPTAAVSTKLFEPQIAAVSNTVSGLLNYFSTTTALKREAEILQKVPALGVYAAKPTVATLPSAETVKPKVKPQVTAQVKLMPSLPINRISSNLPKILPSNEPPVLFELAHDPILVDWQTKFSYFEREQLLQDKARYELCQKMASMTIPDASGLQWRLNTRHLVTLANCLQQMSRNNVRYDSELSSTLNQLYEWLMPM